MMRVAVILVALLVGACSEPPMSDGEPLRLLQGTPDASFERARAPRAFDFPADHGSHPTFQTEWWYLTGNLTAADAGTDFGFQLTIFRFGLAPGDMDDGWATHHLWLAQLAVSDLSRGQFHQGERVSRGALGLAGAAEAGLDVHVENWRLAGPLQDLRLRAMDGEFGIVLSLTALKPIVLQGEAGLSQKSATPGNASYYYSVPRLQATGHIRTPDGEWPVAGLAWMDREWSTSALDADQEGWDWFALHLDDGTDLMLYRLRGADGSLHPYSAGVLVNADGKERHFGAEAITATPGQWWQSNETGRRYPLHWQIAGPEFDLAVTARMAEQEHTGRFHYWEGAVAATGQLAGAPVSGTGYLEMTGYQ